MRAIYIDARTRSVTEIALSEMRAPRLKEMQALVDGPLETAHEFPNRDLLYVDEEGLLKEPKHLFDIGAHQTFAGNGVIVGREVRGRWTPAVSTVEEVRALIIWREVLR